MRAFLVVIGLGLLAGCDREQKAFSYKITEEGGASVGDRRTYETLGDHTFTKTQKYRIVLQGDGDKKFHFLIANIKKRVGNKIIDDNKGVSIPIYDGIFEFECSHYYDLKLSKSVEESDDPVCEITPIGVLLPNASASKVSVK